MYTHIYIPKVCVCVVIGPACMLASLSVGGCVVVEWSELNLN